MGSSVFLPDKLGVFFSMAFVRLAHSLPVSGRPGSGAGPFAPDAFTGCKFPHYVMPPFDWSLHLTVTRGGDSANTMQTLELVSILAWVWRISPVVVGAAGGYLFYRVVGCKTGFCPITRSPWLSTIYGALLGAMFILR